MTPQEKQFLESRSLPTDGPRLGDWSIATLDQALSEFPQVEFYFECAQELDLRMGVYDSGPYSELRYRLRYPGPDCAFKKLRQMEPRGCTAY